MILPDGCKDLDEAADQFLAGLAPDDLAAFEQKLQKAITRKFRGLGYVCLKPLEKAPIFRELLLAKSREFLDTKLDHSNPAKVFFRARTQEGTAALVLSEAFAGAVPVLLPVASCPHEIIVLALPPGDDGDRLLELTAPPHCRTPRLSRRRCRTTSASTANFRRCLSRKCRNWAATPARPIC